MSEGVRYTTRWVSKVRKPFPGHRWLTDEEARAAFEAGSGLDVVDAVTTDGEDNPVPRWVLGIGASGRIRAQFFTPGGAVWRSIDYDSIDGRLWRWICVTYVYPDQDTRYRLAEATRVIEERFLPDRTGSVQFDERDGLLNTATFTDAPVDGFWLDRPAFGDWTNLADPDYGVPTDANWPAPA